MNPLHSMGKPYIDSPPSSIYIIQQDSKLIYWTCGKIANMAHKNFLKNGSRYVIANNIFVLYFFLLFVMNTGRFMAKPYCPNCLNKNMCHFPRVMKLKLVPVDTDCVQTAEHLIYESIEDMILRFHCTLKRQYKFSRKRKMGNS